MKTCRLLRSSIVGAALLIGAGTISSAALAFQPPQQGDEPRSERARGGRRDQQDEKKIKPYEEVITEEAVTQPGVFKVHQVKDKYYFEIPAAELGKDFLWVNTVAKTTIGVGYGGQSAGNRVVRWERKGDRIFLRKVSYQITADKNLPIRKAVDDANNAGIIEAFDIAALGPDNAAVVDVTTFYVSDITEFSAKQRLQARTLDRDRSFIEEVLAFPTNIEVEATQTFVRPPDQNAGAARRAPTPRGRFGGSGMAAGSASVVMHYSMVKLPEDPMMPRLFDERVGYFTARQTDYGRDEQRAQQRTYITRWRLEKKDPNAELSEPVKPITYWVDPATPTKWVPYIKKGIEDWQPAFEAAGFKHGIVAREAPSPEEDPTWRPEDARYSVIRWLPSEIENASGPHIHDPRTGEILDADVQFYHNIQNLLRSWYFLQVGPLDPSAQEFPFSEELMGRLLEYVVTHEVGHTLGFQHNMKASSTYPIEKIRDKEWVHTMGHTPTLMDYSRFNYVAQPEDGIPPQDLFPKIGPYDKWATMWGYKPIAGAKTSDDETETLNKWAMAQDDKPWLRFSTNGSSGSDPGELTEAVGDADAVEATRLGLKNLERATDMLLKVTSKPGENWDDLDELYGRLLGQWSREMNHVAAIVGGMQSREVHAGQEGVRFEPVSKERQKEALAFLTDNAFNWPDFLVRPEILRRIEPVGLLGRVRNAQASILRSLLNPAKFGRLVEDQVLDGAAAYGPQEFMDDLRNGIWTELNGNSVSINAYRRNLQRAYLELTDQRLNGSNAVDDDMRPFLRGELRTLDAQVAAVISRASDPASRFHLMDVRDQIGRILDPKFAPSADSGAANPFQRGFDEGDPEQGCWVDLIIRP